jgi:AraC-like DNA-binding protein
MALYFSEILGTKDAPERYHYSMLNENEKIKTLKKLKDYILLEKSYLNPDINLEMLANELEIKPRDLSQIINEKLHKNFKEFINSYRLEESISQLRNKKLQTKTVLEILYDSGFNSKSSFYSLFEKHTGQSPTQFRKKYFQEN